MANAALSSLNLRALPYDRHHSAHRRGSRDFSFQGGICYSSDLQACSDAAGEGRRRGAHRLRRQAISRFCKWNSSERAWLRRCGVALVISDARSAGLIHTSNLYRTAPGEQLAAKLVERSFASQVFFCNSGAEANEGAFKFARRWARKTGTDAKVEIIALRGSFHGRLFASLAATDRPSYRAPFRPLAGGVSICERDLRDLDTVLDGETVAAVIVEPIQGEGGVRVLDSEFLRRIRAMTTERGIALIFDEIQCGLGRTGHFFAYENG